MNFQVPQYIEYEAKIVGPLTLKQFIYIGSAGAICFILYFAAPLWIFILGALILGAFSVALAFVKIGGRGLPTYFKNFLAFLFKPKIYLWKKKEMMVGIKIVKEEKKKPSFARATEGKEKEEAVSLKIAEKSRLKELATQVETKLK